MIEISHQQARHLIRQSMDGLRLPEGQWSALQLHLDGCAECRAYRDRLGAVERDLRRSLRARLGERYREPDANTPAEVFQALGKGRVVRGRRRKVLTIGGLVLGAMIALALLGWYQARQAPAAAPQEATPTAAATATLVLSQVDFQGALAFSAPAPDLQGAGHNEIYLYQLGAPPEQTRLENLTNDPADDIFPAWSPDGEWLAFLSDRETEEGAPPKYELYVMHVSGSRLTRLTDDPAVTWRGPLSWSMDGQWIALLGQRGAQDDESYVYLVPTQGGLPSRGAARPLAFTRGAFGAARFSPTSMKLAFGVVSPPFQGLTVYDFQSGRFTRLADPEVDAQNLRAGAGGEFQWIGEDNQLIYLAEGPYDPATGEGDTGSPPQTSLWVSPIPSRLTGISPAGEEIQTLPGAGNVRDLSFAMDENGLLAAYLRGGQADGCWTINLAAEGADIAEIGEIPELCVAGGLSQASWGSAAEPGDRPWLFALGRRVGGNRAALYAVRPPDGEAASSARVELVDELPFSSDADLSAVTLEVRPEGHTRLNLAPSMATLQRKPKPASVPHDLPGEILFGAQDGLAARLFTIRPDGSGLRELSGAGSQCPAFAPDGARVAYVVNLNTGSGTESAILLSGRDGTGMRRLTEPQAEPTMGIFGDVGAQYGCPVWSPDGAQLAVIYRTIVNNYLTLIAVESGETVYIPIRAGLPGVDPVWSGDGKILALATRMGRGQAVIQTLEAASAWEGAVGFSALTQAYEAETIYGLAFMADELAYLSGTYARFGSSSLYVNWVRLTGEPIRERVQLPNASLAYYVGQQSFAALPDGRLAALIHDRADAVIKTQLVVIYPSARLAVTQATLEDIVYDMAWSQDGEWLAYTSERGLYLLNPREAQENISGAALLYSGRVSLLDWR